MNPQTLLSAGGLTQWLADFYLVATLLLVIALVARHWIRQPAHRLTVAWLVAIELAALAVVCALPVWPRISLVAATRPPVVADRPPLDAPAPAARPHFRPPVPTPIVHRAAAPTMSTIQEPAETPAPSRDPWTWPGLVAAGYSLGTMLVVLRLLWGAIVAARICRRALPAPESLRAELLAVMGCGADCQSAIPPADWQSAPRVPRLLVSSKMTSAVALGLVRSTILLPAALAADGPQATVRAILAHEWAHIRNRDLWLLALGRCLSVLLFVHPLFWLLRRMIRTDQEALADAVAAGNERPNYAEQLLRWIRMSPASPSARAWAAVGIWESASQVSRRIAMLLDETFSINCRGSRRWQCRAAGLLLLLGAALSFATLHPNVSPAQQQASPAPIATKPVESKGEDAKPKAAVEPNAGIECRPEAGRCEVPLGPPIGVEADWYGPGVVSPDATMLGDGPEAKIARLLAALELDRENATTNNDLAWLLATCPDARFRNGPRAVDCAEKANQRLRGKRPDVLDTLAAAYAEASRFPEALSTARKALDLAGQQDNQDLAMRLRTRIALYEAGKSIADSSDDEAIRRNPNDAGAYLNRGYAWSRKGQHQKAVADFTTALRLDAKNADIYRARSRVWFLKGDYDKAIADCNEILRLNPKDAEAYSGRGEAWYYKGEYDKAIADSNQALQINRDFAAAYRVRGNVWQTKGDYDKAIADYDRTLKLCDCPYNAHTYVDRGNAWREKGNFDKAIADYNEALRINPDDARAYTERGKAWKQKGDKEKAADDFRKAQQFKSKDDAQPNKVGPAAGKPAGKKLVLFYSKAKVKLIGTDPQGNWQFSKYDGATVVLTGSVTSLRLSGLPPSIVMDKSTVLFTLQPGEKVPGRHECGSIELHFDEHGGLPGPPFKTGDAWEITLTPQAELVELHPATDKQSTVPSVKKSFGDGHDQAPEKAAERETGRVPVDLGTLGGGAQGSDVIADDFVGYLIVAGSTDYIYLPFYTQLGLPEFRKELQLSAVKEKRLRAIAAKSEAALHKATVEIYGPLEKLPPSERVKKFEAAGRKMQQWKADQKAVRRQIEDVLTPQQLDAYRKKAMPILAAEMLSDSDVLKTIGISDQQRDQFRRLDADAVKEPHRQEQQFIDRTLAVLSPEQQKQLRSLTDRWGHPIAVTAESGEWQTETRGQIRQPDGSTVETELTDWDAPTGVSNAFVYDYSAEKVDFSLPFPYAELGQSGIRKQLGLNDSQEKQLRAIAATIEKETMKAADAQFKSSREGKRDPEIWRKSSEAFNEAGRQIERLLTQQQLATLKEMTFRNELRSTLKNPRTQAKLGITNDQKAKFRQLEEEAKKSGLSVWRARTEKSFALLTAAQQQKLRDEADRRGW